MRISTPHTRKAVIVLVTGLAVLLGPSAYATQDPAGSTTVEPGTTTEDPTDSTADQGTVVLPEGFDPDSTTSPAIVQPPGEAAAEDAAGSVEYGMEAAATTYWIKCKIKATNPHYSNNAPGVIAKLVVQSCTGNHYGTMEATGYLYRYPPGEIGQSGPRATNIGDLMTVYPGMDATPFYVPAASSSGIYCNLKHWYQASWSAKIYLRGVAGNTRTPLSKMVHPQRCP